MSKAQHTPGPWLFDGEIVKSECPSRAVMKWEKDESKTSSFTTVRICTVQNAYNGSGINHGPKVLIDYDEKLANAHLIAAAPELLEALEYLLSTSAALHRQTDEVGWASVEQARAAIAKAKGE